MRKRRFDGRSARTVAAAVVAMVVLAAAGVIVGGGFARGRPTITGSTSTGTGTAATVPATGKVTICHHTHAPKHPTVTISINVHAWPAHARHGDTVGACTVPNTAGTTSTASTGSTTATTIAAPASSVSAPGRSGEPHGNSGGSHGNSGSHGHRP